MLIKVKKSKKKRVNNHNKHIDRSSTAYYLNFLRYLEIYN